ncbi:MAG: hypothetical protein BHV87_01380 [Clostridiales bacterium 36_14]|nr:MAG: hypothetical protein BHV87_01380 [Clostridiales bacterium 36_14]
MVMQPTDYVKFCPICNETKQNTSLCCNNERFREFTKGYFYLFEPKEDTKICPCCERGVLEDSPLTFEEFKIIDNVSDSDRQFLEAMIELKKNDPIEYQLKMSQFKANLKQQEQVQESRAEENKPRCPTCGSTNIEKISLGKKAVGGALFGIFSSNVRKSMHCKSCGYKW